jgi:hypothetical protein
MTSTASDSELSENQDVPADELDDKSQLDSDKPKMPKSGKSIAVTDFSETEEVKVAQAAEEVNESLKAMAPDLGSAKIETISDDVEEIAEAAPGDTPDQPEDEPTQDSEATEVPVEEPSDSAEDTVLDPPEPVTDDSLEADGLPDDPITQKAVEDIIAEESDAVIAAEDLALELENGDEAQESHAKEGPWLKRLLGSSKFRWVLLSASLLLLGAAAAVPQSRYFVLNSAGVRSSLSLRVIDKGTRQPLKNVTVRVGNSSGETSSDGVVKLDKVRLGRTTLQIEKRAFAPINKALTIGWGSNPLGEFEAEAVGAQYAFVLKDFLSGKPIVGAEANSGDGDAISDSEGKIVLTLDTAELEDTAQLSVKISADTYRQEEVTFSANNKEEQSIDMVPSHRHVFVSKRSGKYDVYSVDVDGKNEQKLVEGTGIERDDITLVPHQSQDIAALVSTRERVTNPSGYLLSTLYVVNTKDGTLVKIDQSEQVQVIGWSESGRLIYVKIAAGMSAADSKRHRLMSFNNSDYADVKELASSNSFNDIIMAGGRIYYAPSNIFQENPNPGLFAIDPDGSNPQTILDKETFNIFRSSYETIDISTGASWFAYTLGSKDKAVSGQAPTSQYSKIFMDNPVNKTSLWVDSRDGKGVLLSYDLATKTDTTLTSRTGLKVPVYWLNETYLVFRLNDGKETADYVLNTDGGEARKISDVTDTNGVDRWYYY